VIIDYLISKSLRHSLVQGVLARP